MACGVALKRSLELDSLLSPESQLKRRRTSINAGHCAPFRPSFSNSPPHSHQQQSQPHQLPQQNTEQMASASGNVNPSTTFVNAGPKISNEELESYLLSEIQSLRRRRLMPRQLNMDGGNDAYYGVGGGRNSPPSNGNSDSESEQHMESSGGPHHSSMVASYRLAQSERPLFSFKQVRLICERLLKEQEIRIREEYDQILNARLAEQYDTFVRFTYDQIHRRIDDHPMTYLS